MIEVEARGKLEGSFNKVLELFNQKAKFIEEKDRFSLIYFRHEVVKDVREIRDEKVDLRLRVTNKNAELILKYGTWGSNDARKEISIPIPLDKFSDFVELLNLIGWNKGVIMATKTFVYIYKNIEFSLVKSKYLNYFEAEKLITDEKGKDKELNSILKLCKEMSLKPFSEEEFMDQINRINNAPGMQFDFKKDNFNDIKNKFKEYF
ncbi:hypothetical protein HY498_00035 [Candidatus Woesearchaeota archaeon]|nr:hypothetical protein [Candidatus Woesearchaeota archaeon]